MDINNKKYLLSFNDLMIYILGSVCITLGIVMCL